MPLYKKNKRLRRNCEGNKSNSEYVLVKYVEDELYYVTHITNLKNTRKEGIKLVKYSDGKTYAAKLICSGSKYEMNTMYHKIQSSNKNLQNLVPTAEYGDDLSENNQQTISNKFDNRNEPPNVADEIANLQEENQQIINCNTSEFQSIIDPRYETAKVTDEVTNLQQNQQTISCDTCQVIEKIDARNKTANVTDLQEENQNIINYNNSEVLAITDARYETAKVTDEVANLQEQNQQTISYNTSEVIEKIDARKETANITDEVTDCQDENQEIISYNTSEVIEKVDDRNETTNIADEVTDFQEENQESINFSTPKAGPSTADSGDENQQSRDKIKQCSYQEFFSDNNSNTSSESEYELDEVSSESGIEADQNCINVQQTKNSLNKRIWDKKQCCLFCSKLYFKLARHFENVHSNEIEVEKFMALNKKSPERLKIINNLKNRGNFVHNTNVISKKKGTIIAKKRPKNEVSVNDYLPCRFCLAFLNRKTLYLHEKSCNLAHDKKKHEKKQGPSSLLLPIKDEANATLRKYVLPIMQQDPCTLVCKNDKLILMYGSSLCNKLAHEKHLHVYISQKMRELGRLMSEVKKFDPEVKDLEELLQISKFDLLVKSVYSVAGFSEESSSFKIPSLAKKLGHSIQKCLNILLSQAVKNNLTDKEKQIDSFKRLYNLEWTNKIARHAVQTLYKNKFNKTEILPVTSDVQKVHKYIKETSDKCSSELKNEFSSKKYMILAKLTLAQVILFNRKRVGEAQRITVQTYNQRNKIIKSSDIYASLSETEKILADKLSRIETRGKRGRCVPIIFHEELEENINLLLTLRKQMKIPDDNEYVFATKKLTTLRGTDALKFVARGAKIDNVNSLTSTKLRKHIATVSQIINLKENELDQLANFMGHDIRVHREFYRLPNDAVQLTKVSKLLVGLQKGTIENAHGKNLDEISIGTPSTSDDSSDEHEEDNPKKKRNFVSRRPWTDSEIKFMRQQFAENLLQKTLPGKNECMECIEKGHIQNRTWQQLKCFVYNLNKK